MSNFSKRYVLRSAYPTIYDDVVFVSEKTMRQIVSEDLKEIEKRYNRHLNNIALDNEMLSLDLKNKNQDYEKLNKQYKTQQARFEELEQEKKSLERKLEAEIRNSVRLTREVNSLQWQKISLQEYIDKIQSEHVEEMRKLLASRRQ